MEISPWKMKIHSKGREINHNAFQYKAVINRQKQPLLRKILEKAISIPFAVKVKELLKRVKNKTKFGHLKKDTPKFTKQCSMFANTV